MTAVSPDYWEPPKNDGFWKSVGVFLLAVATLIGTVLYIMYPSL